jgi:hypothetical protein
MGPDAFWTCGEVDDERCARLEPAVLCTRGNFDDETFIFLAPDAALACDEPDGEGEWSTLVIRAGNSAHLFHSG